MTLPITTFEIYDLLEGDADLMDLLGIHTLADGTVRPALAHFFPREAIEPTTVPSGVEIVVWRAPMGYATIAAQTGEIYQNPTFRLTITQWEPLNPEDPYNMQAILDRLQALLPGSNANDVTIDGLTTGLQQSVLVWRCPTAVLQPQA